MTDKQIQTAYDLAKQQYADLGVDTDAARKTLATVPISIHCWQGDDVGGFESTATEIGGGLAATGNYPGKARTADELRQDAAKALSLIPGTHRFSRWIDWAKGLGIGLDFNPTFFAHPLATSFTLAHPDKSTREFWVRHGIACRTIGAAIGKALGVPCVTNLWIPDCMKDTPVDRLGPRERLTASLDEIFKNLLDRAHNLDAVEGKLFGIGFESYTVGSHEFYFGYALTRRILYTLDTGHYHPTETITDKISAVFMYLPEILLHVSRGVRWDSDHVVVLNDDLEAIAQELVRGNFLGRTHIGLDYFDASINRVAAWVIGTRNMLKALLRALVEPTAILRQHESGADYTTRLALQEEFKALPWGAVWDYHCANANLPSRGAWMDVVKQYEKSVLSARQ
jgi:L-rhamnose isomerase